MSKHPARKARPSSRFAVTVVALVSALQLAGCGKDAAEAVDPETTARLIQPVARVELKIATVAPGSRTGEQVAQSVCAGCHDAGALGAPKTGDAAAWAARIAQGLETLTQNAINGIRAMPPRGGAADLTDTEVQRAVAHLANKAGADFAEPPVEQ